ncbi:hypothetical protein Tco_0121285 [Tanacetum coccineum]
MGNIAKTQTKATSSGPSSPRTSSEGGPGCHFTMGDIPVQARPERVSNLPNEPPLREGNTSRSGEGSMQLLELIPSLEIFVTNIADKVTSLEDELASTKAVYNKALITLTKRVKKLEKQLKHKRRRVVIDSSEDEGPSLDAEDSPKQGRMIEEIDNDETVNLVKRGELGKSHDTLLRHSMEHNMMNDDRTLQNIAELQKDCRQKDFESSTRMFLEKTGGRRKKTLARKRASGKDSEESMKKQKLEDDTEKEDLKAYLDIILGDDVAADIESLATKYPIVDWKTHVLTENFMYYQIIRADGGSKNYKIFSEMLDDFDRQDVMDLHRLVEERYATSRPEGYDLMLWGDLKILFQPDEEDEVWRHQHEYNLISWRLFDSCGQTNTFDDDVDEALVQDLALNEDNIFQAD